MPGRLIRPLSVAILLAVATGASTWVLPLRAEEKAKVEASLYTRLGGYDAIAAVTSDLLPRLMSDPTLGRFWSNRGADGVAREKQLVINFIAAAAGAPLHYAGRELKVSHVGMKITETDWKIFMGHLNATLDKFNLPARERKDVVTFMESSKNDILD